MKDQIKWVSQVRVRRDIPADYKSHAWAKLKDQVGHELYGILEKSRNPAVVEIKDLEITRSGDLWMDYDDLRIEVLVTPVEHQHVAIQKMDAVDWRLPSNPTFAQRLKWLITGR